MMVLEMVVDFCALLDCLADAEIDRAIEERERDADPIPEPGPREGQMLLFPEAVA